MQPLRILIVDDHDVVRRGLRSLLRTRPGWDVCGEAADGREAVEKAKELRPDVIVLDVSMPAMNGLEAARQIRKEVPQSEILILTQHESREMMNEAISAGAKGYVVKSDISRELVNAIEEVGQHRPSYSSRVPASAEGPERQLDESEPKRTDSAQTQSAPADLLYRTVAEAIPNLLFVTDKQGKTSDTNSRCAEYFGLANERRTGWNWTEFVHHEDKAAAESAWQQVLATEAMLQQEFRLQRSDGTYRWHEIRILPVRDAAGAVICWFGSATDIDSQKLASQELRRKEERLGIALEASETGTFRWIPRTGDFVEFGPSLKRLFGLSGPERILSTQDFIRRVHPEDVPAVQAALERSRSGHDLELEFRILLPDGSVRWLYDRAKTITESSGQNVLVGACTDVTRRKQAEEALQKAHDDLELRVRQRTEELERKAAEVIEHARLLDMANDAIFIRNLEGAVFYWNEGAERLYGWSKHDIDFEPLSKLLKTEFPVPFDEILEILNREGKWEGELTHTRRDGSRIVVASRWTAWRNAQGEPIGWLQINTDITERRRVEDGLRAMSARLLHLQDEERRRIARELHDSAGQLLVALKLNLAMVQNAVKDAAGDAARALNESADLTDQLSKELRTISHLLHPPLLDEAGLPSAIRWYVEGFAQRSQVGVDLQLPDDMGRLPRDLETAIFRIVQECLTNIHRHSGSRIATIRITRDAERLTLQVRDSGKGMPVERRDGTSAPLRPGVGLQGMRERVRQLGGRLDVSSGRRGTTVTAVFPLANAARAQHAGSVERAG